jgi:hypothetical protein
MHDAVDHVMDTVEVFAVFLLIDCWDNYLTPHCAFLKSCNLAMSLRMRNEMEVTHREPF